MSHDLQFQSASYLWRVLRDPYSVIDWCVEKLQVREFDVLVGTGFSGCLVVPGVARKMGKKFALVRKDDASHSHTSVEGYLGGRWIFLDDLICTGSTLKRVVAKWQQVCNEEKVLTELVGALMYERIEYWDALLLTRRYGLEVLEPST